MTEVEVNNANLNQESSMIVVVITARKNLKANKDRTIKEALWIPFKLLKVLTSLLLIMLKILMQANFIHSWLK